MTELDTTDADPDIPAAEEAVSFYTRRCLRDGKISRPLVYTEELDDPPPLKSKTVKNSAKRSAGTAGLDAESQDGSHPSRRSKKAKVIEFFPLDSKREAAWSQWMTDRFSKQSGIFSSYPSLHSMYAAAVRKPIALADFEKLRKSHPIFKMVTKEDFHAGYTLKEDYMVWLKKHNFKKWERLQKKAGKAGKADKAGADDSDDESSSVSSFTDDPGLDGFDDTHVGSLGARNEKNVSGFRPVVASPSGTQSFLSNEDAKSEIASYVMEVVEKRLRTANENTEHQLQEFGSRMSGVEAKVDTGLAALQANMKEGMEEIRKDKDEMKDNIQKIFVGISAMQEQQQKQWQPPPQAVGAGFYGQPPQYPAPAPSPGMFSPPMQQTYQPPLGSTNQNAVQLQKHNEAWNNFKMYQDNFFVQSRNL